MHARRSRRRAVAIYEYQLRWVEVIDADTIRAEVSLGLDTYHRITFRLARINAPEMSTVEGKSAASALRSKLANKTVFVRTIRDTREKYGRYLAEAFIGEENINDWLLAEGLAVEYAG